MRKFSLLVMLAVVAISFTSCTTRITDFTLLSTKTHGVKAKASSIGPRVKGEDKAWMIVVIPTGVPNVKTAIDRAIENAGPGYDALVDGVLSSYFAWYVLAGQNGYVVEGTPIKSTDLAYSEYLKDHNIVYHSSLNINNDLAVQEIYDNFVSKK